MRGTKLQRFGNQVAVFRRGWLMWLALTYLALLLVSESVNLQRNRLAGEVFWLNAVSGLWISSTGGWTRRQVPLPDGANFAVVGSDLWWVRYNPQELLRLDPDGRLRRFELSAADTRDRLPQIGHLATAGDGLWAAADPGSRIGDPKNNFLLRIDPVASTYRFVPDMVEAISSSDGRISALLGADGAVHLTGAGVAEVSCPPYRIVRLLGGLDGDHLLLGTRTGSAEVVGSGPGPTVMVDIRTGQQNFLQNRPWPDGDAEASEWWVSCEVIPYVMCRSKIYGEDWRRPRRHVWTGYYGWMISQVGHVDRSKSRLFLAVERLSTEAIANAPHTVLREAASQPTGRAR